MDAWVISNAIWLPYHWLRGDWQSVMLFSAYMGLSVWGFVRWK